MEMACLNNPNPKCKLSLNSNTSLSTDTTLVMNGSLRTVEITNVSVTIAMRVLKPTDSMTAITPSYSENAIILLLSIIAATEIKIVRTCF